MELAIVRRLPRRARRATSASTSGFLVGHCALRRNVMGADARRQRGRRPSSSTRCSRLLHESIAAGGLGFSTTLSFTHSDGDGAAGRVAVGVERRSARAVPRGRASTRARRSSTSPTAACAASRDDEVELMAEMTLAGRRPLNWNVLTIDSPRSPQRYHDQLAACENARDAGRHGDRADDADPRRDEHVRSATTARCSCCRAGPR